MSERPELKADGDVCIILLCYICRFEAERHEEVVMHMGMTGLMLAMLLVLFLKIIGYLLELKRYYRRVD